jgi:hypothetical protein
VSDQRPSNQSVDEQIDKRGQEFDAIAAMISAGNEHGLLVELIWSYGQARFGGDSVVSAVGFACREWDV